MRATGVVISSVTGVGVGAEVGCCVVGGGGPDGEMVTVPTRLSDDLPVYLPLCACVKCSRELSWPFL